MNIQHINAQVQQIARSVGQFLVNEQTKLRKSDIELKGTRNFVTHIDKEAEQILVEKLGELIPDATFLTEEGTVAYSEGAYTWIIDPLDGTNNYIHGNTPYCVSIALTRNKKTILGVVFDPVADELFNAVENEKATLNGKKIAVTTKANLENAYIGFGIPYKVDARAEEILQNAISNFRHSSFRLKGAAAIEICYVAGGRYDAFFHSGLSPWDVAAGAFILECAGGKSTDFSGGENYIFGKEIVASNGEIHTEIMEKIIKM